VWIPFETEGVFEYISESVMIYRSGEHAMYLLKDWELYTILKQSGDEFFIWETNFRNHAEALKVFISL